MPFSSARGPIPGGKADPGGTEGPRLEGIPVIPDCRLGINDSPQESAEHAVEKYSNIFLINFSLTHYLFEIYYLCALCELCGEIFFKAFFMMIIPAIDIRGGKCVRLFQGDYRQETIYGEDPVEIARRWIAQGAGFLHLVDLDGARDGVPRNRETIRRILKIASIPVQIGGGIRYSGPY